MTEHTKWGADDGGPAFAHGDPTNGGDPGMSLRDYFAIHCDQPGQDEIVHAAGKVWSDHKVWDRGNTQSPIGTFEKWWSGLSEPEKSGLYAKVRYQLADAMLAERAKAART